MVFVCWTGVGLLTGFVDLSAGGWPWKFGGGGGCFRRHSGGSKLSDGSAQFLVPLTVCDDRIAGSSAVFLGFQLLAGFLSAWFTCLSSDWLVVAAWLCVGGRWLVKVGCGGRAGGCAWGTMVELGAGGGLWFGWVEAVVFCGSGGA